MILHTVDIKSLPLGTWFVEEFGHCISHSFGDAEWTVVKKQNVVADINSAIQIASERDQRRLRSLRSHVNGVKLPYIAFQG